MLGYLRLYLSFGETEREKLWLFLKYINNLGSGSSKILVYDCRRLSDNRVNRPMIEGLGQQLKAALPWQL